MQHSTVRCGCGFTANGPDQDKLVDLLEAHTCHTGDISVSCYVSFWGWAIMATLGFVALVVMHPEIW